MTRNAKPGVARIWRGRTKAARADEYAKYLYEVGIRPLEEKALAVELLREDRAGESEFVTISLIGKASRRCRALPAKTRGAFTTFRDPEFLIELPQSVQVLEIAASKNMFGSARSSE